jgi:hypothetical protein
LSPITLDEALFVAKNMRPADRKEIFATRWNDDVFDLALDCTFVGKFGWIASLDEPIAVMGCAPLHPGVWSAFCFGTCRFSGISTDLTKFIIRVVCPALVAAGAHRLECWSIDGHTDAHRWLKILGAKRESVRRNYGRRGEDFYCFAWDFDSVEWLAKRHKSLHKMWRAENADGFLRKQENEIGKAI